MAHLLLPTDFSSNALHAAEYALKIFGKEGHTLTVLNTFMAPHAGASVLMSLDDVLARESREGLDMFTARLKEDIDLSGSTVNSLSEHGDLPGVVAVLEEDDPSIDIVVMGTQGASGMKEVLMGSNTADVVRRSLRPVLTVPEKAEIRCPKRIMVADDGGSVDPRAVTVLIDIARRCAAEVMVARVVTDHAKGADASAYKALLADVPHSFRSITGENVEEGLNDMAIATDADMVVMLRRKLGLFEGLFHRSASKRMVMHSHIPLLVLQQ